MYGVSHHQACNEYVCMYTFHERDGFTSLKRTSWKFQCPGPKCVYFLQSVSIKFNMVHYVWPFFQIVTALGVMNTVTFPWGRADSVTTSVSAPALGLSPSPVPGAVTGAMSPQHHGMELRYKSV